MAKTKRLKKQTAGRLVRAVCYTQVLATDAPRARAEKAKCSSAARKKLNYRFAYQKLQMQLAANFTRRDLYVTLTYDDAHLPPNRKAAKKQVAAFFDRMRRQYRRSGKELRYVYVTQELQSDGSRRLHHHLIISATGAGDYDTIRALWPNGDNVEILPIGETEMYVHDDFLELAQYLLHERNPDAPATAVGDRGWNASRNLRKPAEESEMVDESVTVTAPPGAYILDTDHKQNEYGCYDYIVYLLPERRARKG